MPISTPHRDALRAAFRAPILLFAGLLLAAPALAFDYIVTRYDDPAPDGCLTADCSLREAVIAANVDDASDRVVLSAGTYHLTLAGAGENNAATGDLDLVRDIEIVGAGAPLTILDGTGLGEQPIETAGNANLVTAIRGLTIQNGAIFGVHLSVGTHTIEDCAFLANGFGATGPGINMTIQSVVTIRRTLVAGNAGAGLSVTQGSATIEDSTFSDNGSQEIVGNFATALKCTHCTLFDTDAVAGLTAIGVTAVFANSVVAGTCGFSSGGAMNSLGGNVESIGHSCNFSQASDQDDVAEGALALGALTDNGGPTRSHLPAVASVAVGGADDALCSDSDQRGVARTTDCESGAVERTDAAVATPLFSDGFLQGDSEAWSATVN